MPSPDEPDDEMASPRLRLSPQPHNGSASATAKTAIHAWDRGRLENATMMKPHERANEVKRQRGTTLDRIVPLRMTRRRPRTGRQDGSPIFPSRPSERKITFVANGMLASAGGSSRASVGGWKNCVYGRWIEHNRTTRQRVRASPQYARACADIARRTLPWPIMSLIEVV